MTSLRSLNVGHNGFQVAKLAASKYQLVPVVAHSGSVPTAGNLVSLKIFEGNLDKKSFLKLTSTLFPNPPGLSLLQETDQCHVELQTLKIECCGVPGKRDPRKTANTLSHTHKELIRVPPTLTHLDVSLGEPSYSVELNLHELTNLRSLRLKMLSLPQELPGFVWNSLCCNTYRVLILLVYRSS